MDGLHDEISLLNSSVSDFLSNWELICSTMTNRSFSKMVSTKRKFRTEGLEK